MIFITRDGNFTKNLDEFRSSIVVVITSRLFPHPTLTQNSDVIWEFDELMIGHGPIYMKVMIFMIC